MGGGGGESESNLVLRPFMATNSYNVGSRYEIRAGKSEAGGRGEVNVVSYPDL